MYADGECNPGCDTAACNWDGLDCNHDEEKLATGSLIIVVGVPPEEFKEMSKEFLRKLGNLLRAVLYIKKDKNGEEMVYPWNKGDDINQKRFRRSFGRGVTESSKFSAQGYLSFSSY